MRGANPKPTLSEPKPSLSNPSPPLSDRGVLGAKRASSAGHSSLGRKAATSRTPRRGRGRDAVQAPAAAPPAPPCRATDSHGDPTRRCGSLECERRSRVHSPPTRCAPVGGRPGAESGRASTTRFHRPLVRLQRRTSQLPGHPNERTRMRRKGGRERGGWREGGRTLEQAARV